MERSLPPVGRYPAQAAQELLHALFIGRTLAGEPRAVDAGPAVQSLDGQSAVLSQRPRVAETRGLEGLVGGVLAKGSEGLGDLDRAHYVRQEAQVHRQAGQQLTELRQLADV